MSHLRAIRSKKNWTQAELAHRSSVSRSGIAAIETGALVPSVQTALALARSLDCSVEELFGDAGENASTWAWQPSQVETSYWEAAFDRKVLAFPIEPMPFHLLPPDGLRDGPLRKSLAPDLAGRTLIVASCDPAAGLLAAMMNAKMGVRVLSFHRSSNEALSLLDKGVIHAAGIHLRETHEPGGNAAVVRERLGQGYRLLRGAIWHEGAAVRPGDGLKTISGLNARRVRWIGRKQGTGAKRCQDKVLAGAREPRKTAGNHWEVTIAVRQGWVDAGICHQLAAEQAGLEFIPVSKETFDFCYPAAMDTDPRIDALRKVLRSLRYRQSLGSLKGVDAQTTGDEQAA
jgi:molybdate-binding protein/DNA-binding XRE family transcriptional regulator